MHKLFAIVVIKHLGDLRHTTDVDYTSENAPWLPLYTPSNSYIRYAKQVVNFFQLKFHTRVCVCDTASLVTTVKC